ncbi:MAG: hypothetical protein AAF667_02100 [Pseudomonadota bacterium]
MVDLVYVIGSGRSGSTVIERVLNSAPTAFAVGEVHALWRLPMDQLLCSCGAPVADCPFWTEVLSQAGIGPREIADLGKLEHFVVRNRYLAGLRYDIDRIRQDPRLADFIALQRQLFAAIRTVSGATTVIDSSKAGPRAWVLAAGLDPVFLHTYRRATDVLTSWRTPKFEPSTNSPMKKPSIAEAAGDWVKAEQAARALSRRAKVCRISYGDFATDPRTALARALGAVAGEVLDGVQWTGEASVAPAAKYHSVLGNPDRFGKGNIEIRFKRSDPAMLPKMDALAVRSVGRVLETLWP